MHISNKALSFNLKNLRTLNINNCGLLNVSKDFLKPFHYLQKLNMRSNNLNSIPDGFFFNLQKLYSVDLSINKIKSLGKVFRNNFALEHLNLGKNSIKTLDLSFQDLPSLKTLNLHDNELRVIDSGDFSTNLYLKELFLSKNNIYSIGAETFKNLSQLQKLTLEHNKLVSLNKSLSSAPGLVQLSLHYNRLQNITKWDFLYLPLLKRLNLANNQLTTVNEGFKYLNSLTSLTLANNKLKTLSRGSFPEIIKIEDWHLSGNSWICDCRLKWLKEWLNSSGLTDSNILKCSAPTRFSEKEINHVTVENLMAWPSEECESPCTCSCVPNDEDFYVKVDCSSKFLKKTPTAFPNQIGELDLSDNLLSTAKEIKLPPTSNLLILNLERNLIRDTDFYLPNNLKVLKLSNNSLTRFMSYPPSTIKSFTLSSNPWICDCDTLHFRKWMISADVQILDLYDVRCGIDNNNERLKGNIIVWLSEIELCPTLLRNYLLMGVASFVALSLTITAFLFHYHYRYHVRVWLYSRGFTCFKKKDRRDLGKEYDAYVSFTDEDLDAVRDTFLPELEERTPFYDLFVPQRDMEEGNFEINNQIEKVVNSKRTIILLSQHYLKNEFCMEIFRVAFASSLEEKLHRIILVIFGDLPPLSAIDQSLKTLMESSRCLKFTDKLFWDMLRYEMPVILPREREVLNDENADLPLIEW